jgi:hypothetical protein
MTSSDFLEYLLRELAVPICQICPPPANGPAASWVPAYQLAVHADQYVTTYYIIVQWDGDAADE